MENVLTVEKLIEFLQTQQQDLPVCYYKYSEQCLLEIKDISVEEFCFPRNDGWVQSKRPDMPSQPYLVFPGN